MGFQPCNNPRILATTQHPGAKVSVAAQLTGEKIHGRQVVYKGFFTQGAAANGLY
jgi:hypothetical protein